MAGGDPASRGLNLLTRAADGRVLSLGGKNTVQVEKGDILTIHTPGGGGYGDKNSNTLINERSNPNDSNQNDNKSQLRSSGSLNQYTLNQESV